MVQTWKNLLYNKHFHRVHNIYPRVWRDIRHNSNRENENDFHSLWRRIDHKSVTNRRNNRKWRSTSSLKENLLLIDSSVRCFYLFDVRLNWLPMTKRVVHDSQWVNYSDDQMSSLSIDRSRSSLFEEMFVGIDVLFFPFSSHRHSLGEKVFDQWKKFFDEEEKKVTWPLSLPSSSSFYLREFLLILFIERTSVGFPPIWRSLSFFGVCARAWTISRIIDLHELHLDPHAMKTKNRNENIRTDGRRRGRKNTSKLFCLFASTIERSFILISLENVTLFSSRTCSRWQRRSVKQRTFFLWLNTQNTERERERNLARNSFPVWLTTRRESNEQRPLITLNIKFIFLLLTPRWTKER